MWNKSTTRNGWFKKLQHSIEVWRIKRCMIAKEGEIESNAPSLSSFS
jgi:hypothetical protein